MLLGFSMPTDKRLSKTKRAFIKNHRNYLIEKHIILVDTFQYLLKTLTMNLCSMHPWGLEVRVPGVLAQFHLFSLPTARQGCRNRGVGG